jgi:S1-C subfamily serine protease
MGTCRRKSAWINSTVTAGIVSAKGRGIGILEAREKQLTLLKALFRPMLQSTRVTQEEHW